MIEISNVNFSYSKKHLLFNDLSLNLKPGNIYGLLGRNGAGKTTLLKIISGMLSPQNGLCFLDKKKTQLRKPETLQEIFFIPEEFSLPNVSADKFGELYSKFYPKFDNGLFYNCMNDFGVDKNTLIKELSFGQKKQVLISFGIACNTKYLILDEPTNALDIPSKSIFRKMLAAAVNESRSIIISTHQIRDLESMIDPIIVLDQGKVIFNETQEAILNRLVFKSVKSVENPNVLYAEEKLGAYNAICENSDQAYSNINLELLFNGIIKDPSVFSSTFKAN